MPIVSTNSIVPLILYHCCCYCYCYCLLATRGRKKATNKTDPYLGFPDELLRDIWYRIIKEVISGWKIIFSEFNITY